MFGRPAIAAVLVTLAGPAPAQQAIDVAKHFQVFDSHCRPAMQGVEALKAAVPVPGPTGEKVFSVSPDGNLIAYQTGVEDVLVIGTYRYGPGFVLQECMVQQITADTTTADVLEQAFLAQVPRGPSITMVGGQVQEEIPAVGMFALGGAGQITDRREYMVTGALEEPQAILIGSFGPGNFRLLVSAMVAR